MAYKPFNLKQAEEQNGEGLITRDGRPARIVCFDRLTSDDYCLVVLIPGTTGKEELPHFYDKNGQSWEGPHNFELDEERSDDLLMAPTKRQGWVNIYEPNSVSEGKNLVGGFMYKTKVEAEVNAQPGCIAQAPVEWEE